VPVKAKEKTATATTNLKTITAKPVPADVEEKSQLKTEQAPVKDSKEIREAIEGLKGLKYYTKSLEIDERNKTAVTSLFSGPITGMKWKFTATNIILNTECETNYPRELSLEIKMKESVAYKLTAPFNGLKIKSQDSFVIKKLQRESRIAEKIKKLTPPFELKIKIAAKVANVEITSSTTKNNVKILFNLAKDLGYFLKITLK